MFSFLSFWLCWLLVGVFALVFANVVASASRQAREAWTIFWRTFCSLSAVMIVVFSWTGWLGMHPVLAFAILSLGAMVAVSLAAEVADVHPGVMLRGLAALWMFLCMGLTVFYGVLNAPSILHKLERDIGGTWFPWLMVLVVGVLGGVAHLFKRLSQRLYGATEVLFGLATMYEVALTWPKNGALATQWVAIIGSAYIVARGLNNLHATAAKAEA